MTLKALSVITGLAVLPALGLCAVAPPARAQAPSQEPAFAPAQPAPPKSAHAGFAHYRQRVEINPRPLLYRRCVDWYELQHRPSGTVLYPQMRCWWVRG
jgi:hypothetical protein